MTCPTPSKTAHRSEGLAWAEARRHPRFAGVELLPYRCKCGSWHVGTASEAMAKRKERG